MRKFEVCIACGVLLTSLGLPGAAARGESITAEKIYEATGVRGGLVVHVGAGELTESLRINDRYLVHGLTTDRRDLARTRKRLQARGAYGPISVSRFDGKTLPYVDSLVNLLIVSCKLQDPGSEIERVLCRGGAAVVRQEGNEAWLARAPHGVTSIGGGFVTFTKPGAPGFDEWSHFLHDAAGNAVAKDRHIGSPRSLRWVAGPRWCRSHEFPSSVQGVVMAGGRIFTIFDEGPTGVYRKLPQRCKLVARDAANGVLLWKTPLRQWSTEYGTGMGGRWSIHHTIPRRLIASGDRVYVTLQFLRSPVSVLDAATGKVLTESLEGTLGADEMILSGGVLIVKTTRDRSVGATMRITQKNLRDTLVAVDVAAGKQLWRKEGIHVAPYALSAAGGRVVYHTLTHLVCLDARRGDEIWRTENIAQPALGGGSTLVLDRGVVLYHGFGRRKGDVKLRRYLTALSLDSGKVLWRRRGTRSLAGACTQPTDVFAINGLVWCGKTLEGYDIHTGEVKKTVDVQQLISPGHHYRCHRAKATSRYMIWPKRGAEFIDLHGEQHMRNDWLRAPCFTGLTPANGLTYVPPNQCLCYPGVKVFGFLAMSSREDGPLQAAAASNLERGPAFETDTSLTAPEARVSEGDWPMYRKDGQRSGSTKTAVPVDLARRWEVRLACRGTQPIIVGDRLWVVEKDAHRVRCLDAADGKDIWSFTAGGRIDSPPTFHAGRLLFGCRDGSVVCLRAADGVLAWRFRAAPRPRCIVSFGQIESVWPVQGSVLVENGIVYFAAGRSSFLDGGILVYALDARSGRVLHRHLLKGPWPDIRKDKGRPFAMEGALADLIVSDGKDLYMERIKFDAELNRLETRRESSLGELDMGANHLVATGGFLDDTGFDRVYWMYSRRWPGFYFAQEAPKSGQLVVFDESTTYAVKYFYRRIVWSPAFFPQEKGYLLFADDNDNEPVLQEKGHPIKIVDWLPAEARTDKFRRGGRGVEKGTGYQRRRPAKWQEMIPVRVRAMVVAGGHLFVAGPPDKLVAGDPLAAFEGRAGALLQVYSAADGSHLKSYPLSSPPAFDGLSAAGGRLYLATRDGRLLCYGARTP